MLIQKTQLYLFLVIFFLVILESISIPSFRFSFRISFDVEGVFLKRFIVKTSLKQPRSSLCAFQLVTRRNGRFMECSDAQKECNKEKNRNSSVVPCRSHAAVQTYSVRNEAACRRIHISTSRT